MQRLLIAVALLMLAPLATAQVYKWTDAKGTVHYSEGPPPQGTAYSQVRTTGTVEPLVKPAATTASDSSGRSSESTLDATKPMADTPDNRKSLCVSLKANLGALNGEGPVVMQQDGRTTTLNAAQRQQQLSNTQAQYDQYCKG